MNSSTRRAVLRALAGAAGLGLGSRRAAAAPVSGQLTAGGIRKLTELRYVSGSRGGAQTLDLYLPALPSPKVAQAATAARPEGAAPAKGVPLLVFFHGGAWISGDKDQYALLGLSLATQGFAVAIPNYRLAGDGGPRHPAQVQDAAQAVAWLRQHAAEYGYQKTRVVVGGHSAGAHISAMLAFAPEFLKAYGDSPESLCGFIGLNVGLNPSPSRKRVLCRRRGTKRDHSASRLSMRWISACPQSSGARTLVPMSRAISAKNSRSCFRNGGGAYSTKNINPLSILRAVSLSNPGDPNKHSRSRSLQSGSPKR